MGVPLSADAKTALDQRVIELRKRLFIVKELFNADLRVSVDVSRFVSRWGHLTGVSTIKSDNWVIPSLNPSLVVDDQRGGVPGYLMPGHADSLWTAFGAEPKECWIQAYVDVRLASGTWATVQTYHGKIIEAVPKPQRDRAQIDLVTRFAGDEQMDVAITKNTGDEHVAIGSGW